MANWTLLLSCEHGGNHIPPQYTPYFRGQQAVLASHQGWDPGALELTQDLEAAFKVEAVTSEVSRLVVDLNRSVRHPNLMSSRLLLDLARRNALLEEWYWPYRRKVEARIDKQLARSKRVLHLSVHSFTPVLKGKTRTADIGLLYDSKQDLERAFCHLWRSSLREIDAALRVKMNYPYRGTSDGLTTALRKKYPPESYLGIELEVNQAFPLGPKGPWQTLRQTLIQSLRQALKAQGF